MLISVHIGVVIDLHPLFPVSTVLGLVSLVFFLSAVIKVITYPVKLVPEEVECHKSCTGIAGHCYQTAAVFLGCGSVGGDLVPVDRCDGGVAAHPVHYLIIAVGITGVGAHRVVAVFVKSSGVDVILQTVAAGGSRTERIEQIVIQSEGIRPVLEHQLVCGGYDVFIACAVKCVLDVDIQRAVYGRVVQAVVEHERLYTLSIRRVSKPRCVYELPRTVVAGKRLVTHGSVVIQEVAEITVVFVCISERLIADTI